MISSLLAPQFPKELVTYSLTRTGFNCPDPRVSRLVALAAQKFITEISDDALQFCKIRQQNPALRDKQRGKEKRLVLTMDDLSAALKDYGINLRKPEYFADRVDGAPPPALCPLTPGARRSGTGRGPLPPGAGFTLLPYMSRSHSRRAGVLQRDEAKGGALKGESDAEGKPAAARRPRKKKAAAATEGAPDSPRGEKPKKRKGEGKEKERDGGGGAKKDAGTS